MIARIAKLTLWLIFVGISCQSTLRAQTSLTLPTTGTSGGVDFEFRLDGSLYENGSGSSSLSDGDVQSSSRFLWYPSEFALRAGGGFYGDSVSGIGPYSVAFGNSCIASGAATVAMGGSSTASGGVALAMGLDSTASGFCSMAVGEMNTASGTASVATGDLSMASGNYSLAMNFGSTASGSYSVAMGSGSTASGNISTAMGSNTTAIGNNSTAMGLYTSANSFNSLVIGQYNLGLSETGATPNTTGVTATDPALEIGSGSSGSLSDAFVVYKNGDAAAHGTIRCAAGGDLSMGSFTAGTAP